MKKTLCLFGFLFLFLGCFSAQVTDINGKTYKTVVIGSQIWMAENLNVDKFRNGDPIPQAKTVEEWNKAGKEGNPAWCYYNNDTVLGKKYGKLYNWFAVNDSRGIAPEFFHVTSYKDWEILENYLIDDVDIKIKIYGTNTSGFAGKYAGIRINGRFENIERQGCWWSSDELNLDDAYFYLIQYSDKPFYAYDKSNGYSIRCVKN